MQSSLAKSWFILSMWLMGLQAWAVLNVSIQPNPVQAGVDAQMILTSDENIAVVPALPNIEGLVWVNHGRPSTSRSIQIVNGKRSAEYKTVYTFRITEPGVIEVPRFDVHLAGKTHQSGGFTIRSLPVAVGNTRVEDLVQLKVKIDGQDEPPASIYTGQVVHLKMELYVDPRVNILANRGHGDSFVRPENYFPTIELGDLIWRDYSEFNPHNRHFFYKDMVERQVDGQTMRMFEYRAAFRVLEPGTIGGQIRHAVPVIVGGSRNDPFQRLMGGNARVYKAPVSVTIEPIEVKPLPAAPEGEASFLGLVGEWEVIFTLSEHEVTIGDDLALNLEVRGQGNIESFSPPKWQLPGFNVYEPEVSRQIGQQEQQGKATWVVVPRTVKSGFPPLAVMTFSPAEGTYLTHRFAPELVVHPGQAGTMSGPRIVESGTQQEKLAPTAERAAHDIIYIKEEVGESLQRPLWRYRLPLLLVLLAAGPLGFLGLHVWGRRRARLGQDLPFRRKQEALRSRRRLRRKLRGTSDEDLPAVVRQELVPYVSALLGLPPGTTIDELRRKVDDPELIELLEMAQHGGYVPGSKRRIERDRLLSVLARLSCLVLLLGVAMSSWGQGVLEQASAAYDQGNYAKAAEIYGTQLAARGPTPGLLYNLGNCAYARGELGEAIAWYEEARRLSPRDSDIIENLNFVRGQLNLPPVLQVRDPLSLLAVWRDHLRPDEWLLLAGCCWLAAWLVLGLGRIRERRLPWPAAAIGGLMALCLVAAFTQSTSTYRANQAIVVVDDVPVYRLPNNQEGQAKLNLDEAEYVEVIESRTDWTRIRTGQAEGWIRADAIRRYW